MTVLEGVRQIASPSSRKAGIEIQRGHPRKGLIASPSSRKAGIEIRMKASISGVVIVAFLTEGGD